MEGVRRLKHFHLLNHQPPSRTQIQHTVRCACFPEHSHRPALLVVGSQGYRSPSSFVTSGSSFCITEMSWMASDIESFTLTDSSPQTYGHCSPKIERIGHSSACRIPEAKLTQRPVLLSCSYQFPIPVLIVEFQ
jgi:hypothetical protein